MAARRDRNVAARCRRSAAVRRADDAPSHEVVLEMTRHDEPTFRESGAARRRPDHFAGGRKAGLEHHPNTDRIVTGGQTHRASIIERPRRDLGARRASAAGSPIPAAVRLVTTAVQRVHFRRAAAAHQRQQKENQRSITRHTLACTQREQPSIRLDHQRSRSNGWRHRAGVFSLEASRVSRIWARPFHNSSGAPRAAGGARSQFSQRMA